MSESSFEPNFIRSLRAVLFFPGFLMGKDCIRDCMNDQTLRAFFGNTLYYEFMPSVHLEKAETEKIALHSVEYMLNDSSPMAEGMNQAVQAFRGAIDILETYLADQGEWPKNIVLSLAAQAFVLAGLRREEDRYTLLRNGCTVPVELDSELASRFSHLSADMPAEDLSYAFLADVTLWGEDIRRIGGLEEYLTRMIEQIQIRGFGNVIASLTE